MDHRLVDAVGLDDAVVERLEQPFRRAARAAGAAEVGDVPLHRVGADLRAHIRDAGERVFLDGDAEHFLDRIQQRLALGGLVGAAVGGESDGLLCRRRQCNQGGHTECAAQLDQKSHLSPRCFCCFRPGTIIGTDSLRRQAGKCGSGKCGAGIDENARLPSRDPVRHFPGRHACPPSFAPSCRRASMPTPPDRLPTPRRWRATATPPSASSAPASPACPQRCISPNRAPMSSCSSATSPAGAPRGAMAGRSIPG